MIISLFILLSVLAVFSAIMSVFSKNPVHSILFLILCFFGIAAHYILLNAEFLAIVNIIVYAGAIMVLFLFAVMLLNLSAVRIPKKRIFLFAAVVSGGILLLAMISAIKGFESKHLAIDFGSKMGSVENLGMLLFDKYILPFEVSSILFISAMVGAIILIKKEQN
jgi:NADH-quinone oxidoreductase subunit J